MGFPRRRYVKEGTVAVYHCFSRCVRRAFLCGFDPISRRDFSHRKAWIVERLRFLASIFAIEVCAYAVLDTHYHSILRSRPDIAASWSNQEVAARWLTLFPNYYKNKNKPDTPTDHQIATLALDSQRIAQLRIRLSSISWFMGRLNEFIARAANSEENLKGRFWESRFKCLPLLDLAAIAACMVYVDLNPIRAGIAPTPELSDFTSIQDRIRAWHSHMLAHTSPPPPIPDTTSAPPMPALHSPLTSHWLCPILSDPLNPGILQIISDTDYFDLVDISGRFLRSGQRGAIDPDLAPILLRIGVNPDAWLDTISHFQAKFHLAAGLVSSLRNFALLTGRRWLAGLSAARIAFADSPLPSA